MNFKSAVFVLIAVVAVVAGVFDYVATQNPGMFGSVAGGVSEFFDNPTGFVTGIYKEDAPKTVDFSANLTFAAPLSLLLDFKEPVEVVRVNYANIDNVFYINGISMSAVESTLFEARDFRGKAYIGRDAALDGKAKQLLIDKAFLGGEEEEIKVVAKNITYNAFELSGVPPISLVLPGASGKMVIYSTGDTVTYDISNKDVNFITFGGNMRFEGNRLGISGIGTIKTSTLTTITD